MLSKVFFAAATACGLFLSSVNAHMVIRSPVPYGADSLNNSPLEPDGSDFPCKQRSGVYDVTTMNNMPVGVPQTLAFTGGASHGGGSCQVSVTLDKAPTKDSDWKVIHSIIGGCPTNDTGNISGDPKYEGAATFDFSIPKGIPNGQYTLAWTWFNKVGNREMYMNCAPITVTGGADNNDVLNSLPSMFVANVPADKCTTTEGTDVVFPDPGNSVETGRSANPGKPSGSACGASDSSGSGGSPAGPPAYSSAASFAAPASTQATAPSYGTGSSSPTGAPANPAKPPFPFRGAGVVNGGVSASTFQIIPTAGPAPAAPTGATSPSSDTASEGSDSGNTDAGSSAPPSYQAPSSANSITSSGSCSGGAVTCPTPGSVVCIGNSQWGLCDINNCAVPMALAAGTSCAAGVVSKRHLGRHQRSHLHHGRTT
ncbi:hypothetical protein TI39_contig354g00081 [Zymoseptoria brevis]|uniref:Uncharacterized protein n=1 Tax=Zymoseptoria brevis TaxID=1047168 RepID=A0A0F4GQ36_9PEZI|nr:hypothetical protein TI39_contig354g00081 [Zymoseptoria brevis]